MIPDGEQFVPGIKPEFVKAYVTEYAKAIREDRLRLGRMSSAKRKRVMAGRRKYVDDVARRLSKTGICVLELTRLPDGRALVIR